MPRTKNIHRVGQFEKLCSKCGVTKRSEDFSKKKASPDGRYSYCKSCGSTSVKLRASLRIAANSFRVITEKKCSKCMCVLPVSMFHVDRHSYEGRRSTCKSCRKHSPSYVPKYDESVARKMRARRLLNVFNLTLEQYEEMLVSQNGVCAICGCPETVMQKGKLLPLSVDHDHATGKVRALLCASCNIGLGHVECNLPHIPQFIAYLSEHGSSVHQGQGVK